MQGFAAEGDQGARDDSIGQVPLPATAKIYYVPLGERGRSTVSCVGQALRSSECDMHRLNLKNFN